MSDVVWVQMTITISGGRADGRSWPDRWGAAIDLPAAEAWPLIRAGNAIEVTAPVAARPLPPPASATPAAVSEPAATARGPVVVGEAGPELVNFSPGGVVEAGSGDGVVSFGAPERTPEGGVIGAAADEPPVRERPDFSAPDVADLEPPKPADPKQAWVEHAMAHGESEDEANMQTKAGLMSKYGGRL